MEHISGPARALQVAARKMFAWISRTIVENHSGKLWYEPNEEVGSTFTFTIPRARMT